MTKNHSMPGAEAAPSPDFRSFGLKDVVLQGVDEAGFKVPSPIQLQAIPVIMSGRDLIGQAHTGTGKTAAFGLPALNALKNTGKVEVLVITPTRELATQVSEEIFRLGKFLRVRSIPVYGGQPYPRQIESIRRGAQVVVATPGRLLDLLEGKSLRDAFQPWLVVIDEADEMLDMGFIEDVQKILEFVPGEHQTLLFSATMPRPIQDLAGKFMKDPAVIRVDQREPTSREIQQQYYVIDEHERDDATMRLIDSLEPSRAMIFCRTKSEVDRLASSLAARGILTQPLHGDMEQPMRERVLKGFRKGDFQVLVATDVAARGIDVADVSHVFNYHIPYDTDSYVHRVGRTGRAGRKGVAITLVTPQEYHGLRRIQSKVGLMQHNLIPTHRELKRANERKLLESIRMQPVDAEVEQFVQTLEEELGPAQAANKMAALLLARDTVTGPDLIGVHGPRLKRLQEPSRPSQGREPVRYKRPTAGGSRYKDRPARKGSASAGGAPYERPYKKAGASSSKAPFERPLRKADAAGGGAPVERSGRKDSSARLEPPFERPFKKTGKSKSKAPFERPFKKTGKSKSKAPFERPFWQGAKPRSKAPFAKPAKRRKSER